MKSNMRCEYFLIVIMYSFINGQENNQKLDKYDRFKAAILAQDEREINKLINMQLDPNIIVENDMDGITFAFKNNKIVAAHFIAQVLNTRIHTLQSVFIAPFQKAAETNDVGLLEKAMQLDMPIDQKKIGCKLAFGIACSKNYFSMVEELTNSYDKYLENPCKIIEFQNMAIGFPENHAKIIEHVLKRPQAVFDLETMISKKDLAFPEEIEKYKKLLAQAQQLFFDQLLRFEYYEEMVI